MLAIYLARKVKTELRETFPKRVKTPKLSVADGGPDTTELITDSKPAIKDLVMDECHHKFDG